MQPADSSRASDIAAIAARFGLADIYVFGSRADEVSGSTTRAIIRAPESDIDIAVRSRVLLALTPEVRVALTLAVERALGVGRVDLVVLSEASPMLALAAIRGHLLYCGDVVDQAEYELFVLRRAGDLAPLERERQEIVLQGGR